MSRLKGIAALILAGFLCAGSPAASGCGASPQEALKEGLKALFMDRNNEKALALFQEAVKTGKPGTLFESYYYLGLTQQLLEKFPDSLDSLAQALKYAPEAEAKTSAAILPACYSIMGASHYATGSYAEAAAAYRKSLDLAPVSLTCIALANVHIALGQFGEAEADAERSRRIDPNAPYYYEIMGNVRAGQRHYLEAVGFYRQAAEAFPAFLDKYRRVGVLMKAHPSLAALPDEARQKALGGDSLIKEGRFDLALREYLGAVAAAPFNPQLRINTALICDELKDYGGAIEHMTIYLQLQPDAANAAAAREGIARWQARREEDKTKARGTK